LKVLWLLTAFGCGVAGFGWLALAMEPHWRQVRGTPPPTRAGTTLLRGLGALSLLLSLAACLRADHPTMAVLVWVMLLAAAALAITFTLSSRPALLSPLCLRRPARR
jgi:hypothetical protein